MKKLNLHFSLAVFLIIAVSIIVSIGSASNKHNESSDRYSIICDGFEREFVVHLPTDYDENEEYPLVLCFHGRGGTARHTEKKTGFSDIADRENFIVVYPEGINRAWYLSGATSSIPDDINFTMKLIEHLEDEFLIDKNRIYATGHSNGGFQSIFLAVKHSDTFAAIASVAGGLSKYHAQDNTSGSPISVLLIHGSNDPTVPFDGGVLHAKVKRASGNKFEIISAPDLADFWIKHNKCDNTPVTVDLPNESSLDGTTVTVSTWSGGLDDTEVVLYTINGGWHGWPTKNMDASSLKPGTCREIEAAEEIWKFFAKHENSIDSKHQD